jgi:uncharacterized membrane protein YphA (DoxX/SURF4 family)
MEINAKNTNVLRWSLTIVRIIIGWHFLYEGVVKLASATWSSAAYLSGSRWIFSGVFQSIVDSEILLRITDLLNMWGLTIIGIALILGIFTRLASFCGALLMLLYVAAFPPFLPYLQGLVTDGSYLWVNRNLIELMMLVTIGVVPSGLMFGTDRIIIRWNEAKIHKPIPEDETPLKTDEIASVGINRRDVIRDLVSLPVLGAFTYALYRKKKFYSWEEKFLTTNTVAPTTAAGAPVVTPSATGTPVAVKAATSLGPPITTDATTGATLMSFEFTALQNLINPCPKGKIGNLELSRLIAGGNLIGGWAHSRDLIYVSKLIKAYHTDDKVIQTLSLAEKCGINALLCNPSLARVIHKYWNEAGGKIHFISDCQVKGDFIAGAKKSIEYKAAAAYCGGEMTDTYVRDGKFDIIREGLDIIRAAGIPAGIGAHKIESIEGCVKEGIIPDFWMKTVHNWDYWSSMAEDPKKIWKDNYFDYNPPRTIEFMNSLGQPWIGFKVLAAGSINPEVGFQYAFENGADFITVGMYDFQVVDDVNIVTTILPDIQNRKRPWCG